MPKFWGDTLPKTNMDTQKEGLEKVTGPFFPWQFLGINSLDFGGVVFAQVLMLNFGWTTKNPMVGIFGPG